jgi:hypothetical protein
MAEVMPAAYQLVSIDLKRQAIKPMTFNFLLKSKPMFLNPIRQHYIRTYSSVR